MALCIGAVESFLDTTDTIVVAIVVVSVGFSGVLTTNLSFSGSVFRCQPCLPEHRGATRCLEFVAVAVNVQAWH